MTVKTIYNRSFITGDQDRGGISLFSEKTFSSLKSKHSHSFGVDLTEYVLSSQPCNGRANFPINWFGRLSGSI